MAGRQREGHRGNGDHKRQQPARAEKLQQIEQQLAELHHQHVELGGRIAALEGEFFLLKGRLKQRHAADTPQPATGCRSPGAAPSRFQE